MLPASVQYTIVDGQSWGAAEATLQLYSPRPLRGAGYCTQCRAVSESSYGRIAY
jgi:hypothetical protein